MNGYYFSIFITLWRYVLPWVLPLVLLVWLPFKLQDSLFLSGVIWTWKKLMICTHIFSENRPYCHVLYVSRRKFNFYFSKLIDFFDISREASGGVRAPDFGQVWQNFTHHIVKLAGGFNLDFVRFINMHMSRFWAGV